jgi:hypothetical protein
MEEVVLDHLVEEEALEGLQSIGLVVEVRDYRLISLNFQMSVSKLHLLLLQT